MKQNDEQDTCGAGWVSNDGSDDLTCGKKPSRHIVHEDTESGDRFVGGPIGVVSWGKKRD